jgi:hypothetical protein
MEPEVLEMIISSLSTMAKFETSFFKAFSWEFRPSSWMPDQGSLPASSRSQDKLLTLVFLVSIFNLIK